MTGDFVQITIRDEGPGIPLNIIERIFDPYFTTKQEGHGLGLSVVNSIVEQHGGRIHVDSSTGVGSTFDVFLPALSDAKALGAAETAPEDEEHGGAAALHILLMDDDAMIRKIVDKLISHLGHTVETAADGDMALLKYSEARANGNSFDLVLMDLTIRGSRGGDDVVRQLLDIDPGARVIVASGYASNPVMANYMDYGFSGKLVKPYKLADLKREITRVVNETKPQ
jgi:CheY-like chemotaxis protein